MASGFKDIACVPAVKVREWQHVSESVDSLSGGVDTEKHSRLIDSKRYYMWEIKLPICING